MTDHILQPGDRFRHGGVIYKVIRVNDCTATAKPTGSKPVTITNADGSTRTFNAPLGGVMHFATEVARELIVTD